MSNITPPPTVRRPSELSDLRRRLRAADAVRARRAAVLEATRALMWADDIPTACGVLADAAMGLEGAAGAWVTLVGAPPGALASVRGDGPGAGRTASPGTRVDGWQQAGDDVIVTPLVAAGVLEGHLWMRGTPGPRRAPADDDLLVLAGLAAGAVARIAALAAARRQAAIAQAVIDAAPDAIALVTDDGARLVTNARHRAAEASPAGLPAPDEGTAALGVPVEHAGRSWVRTTAPVVTADGERLGRVVVHRDVTAEREAARARDEFLAMVSHELRTPLTSVVGYLDALAEGDAGPLHDDQRTMVGVALRNAERLRRIVGDLLALAHARAGGMAVLPSDGDLARAAREAVVSATPAALARGVTLRGPDGDGVPATFDPERMGQVIDNLVGNALAYCPAGSTVSVSARSGGGWAEVRVADDGPGIPARERERVFDAFARGATARGTRGTGLGLAVCRDIAEAHGGSISLDDGAASGTAVVVRIPTRSAR